MLEVIKRPLISEKNSLMAEKGIYTFEVSTEATKPQIRNAIEKAFKVKVSSVKTLVTRGRSKRTRGGQSKIRYSKKAFVRLAAGEKISLFEGA